MKKQVFFLLVALIAGNSFFAQAQTTTETNQTIEVWLQLLDSFPLEGEIKMRHLVTNTEIVSLSRSYLGAKKIYFGFGTKRKIVGFEFVQVQEGWVMISGENEKKFIKKSNLFIKKWNKKVSKEIKSFENLERKIKKNIKKSEKRIKKLEEILNVE